MLATFTSNKRFKNALIATSALVAIGSTSAAHALTAAGELIQSQATATFNDSIGNPYSAQSNIASVEVKQVYFATLGSDAAKVAASNQTVNFPHLLTNTGNGTDTYAVSVAQDYTNADSGDYLSLAVYRDVNDNGIVDAGEVAVTSVTLAAGESASLIVVGALPTALEGQTYASTITVGSGEAGAVITDVTASKGADGADGTNEDVVTISGDAVLNVVEASVHDEINNTITYTVTATNTGNEPAKNVVLFAGIPVGSTLVSQSQSGFGIGIDSSDVNAASSALTESTLTLDLNGNGALVDDTESQLGLDLDGDGVISANAIDGVYGMDADLASGTTIEMSIVVQYDPVALGAGTTIRSGSFVAGNLDDDGATADGYVASNIVTDTVPNSYSVNAADTTAAAADDVNDGGDDDNLLNDTQLVNAVQSGETVVFLHDITNTGNGADTFELATSGSTFPTGTSFSFWNEAGTIQLLNTNGADGSDTGSLAQGETRRIMVKAQLPAGVSKPGVASEYTLTATSASDPTGTPSSDETKGVLGSILAPSVDLTTLAADNDANANAEVYANDATPVAAREGLPGDTVTFDIFVQNDSTVSDSFSLSAGGDFVGGTLGSLPAGWSVVFKDAAGDVVTSTPSLPEGTVFTGTAEVTIPSTMTNALADRTSFDIDGVNTLLDGNGDGDGDFAIFFYTESVNSGAFDYLLNSVDVNEVENLNLQQNNSGQVQPGGSIDFPHTVSNDGNTTENVSIFVTNGTPGWSFNVLIDADGDGAVETPYASLTAGSTMYYLNAAGTPTAGVLDANGELPLQPNESVPFTVRTFAPTNAPNGQLNVLTVAVLYNNSVASVENTDSAEVNNAQMRLTKTAALDAGCGDAATTNLGPDAGFSETLTRAEPGDCVVWQVVGVNAGGTHITDVVINDSVPAFSMFESGSLRMCKGDAGTAQTEASSCTFVTLSDSLADDEGEHNSGTITFIGGQGSSGVLPTGRLESGESVTVRFATKVE